MLCKAARSAGLPGLWGCTEHGPTSGASDPWRRAVASVDDHGVDTAVRPGAGSRYRPYRWFWVFFAVGAVVTVPVAMLSLLLPAVESVSGVLTPGLWLLTPLVPAMAGWPGAVNLLLGSLANGLLLGVVGVLVCGALRLRERRP